MNLGRGYVGEDLGEVRRERGGCDQIHCTDVQNSQEIFLKIQCWETRCDGLCL